MSNESIGNRIKYLRMLNGWTQGEMGAKLGVGQSQISRWERDMGEMWPSTRKDICRTFGLTPEWLNAGKGPIFITHDKAPGKIPPLLALRKSLHALEHGAAARGAALDLDQALAALTRLATDVFHNQQLPTSTQAAQILNDISLPKNA